LDQLKIEFLGKAVGRAARVICRFIISTQQEKKKLSAKLAKSAKKTYVAFLGFLGVLASLARNDFSL